MTQLWPLDNQPAHPPKCATPAADRPISLLKFIILLGITHPSGAAWIEKFPFAGDDATAGSETELQASVAGARQSADLAQAIEDSAFFKNLVKRAVSGDARRRGLMQLQAYLESSHGIWENSWVRFPRHLLNGYALSLLHQDMRAGKSLGAAIADETLLRYLLTQLLIQYANDVFELKKRGQKALVCFCPHPPVRQKQLNGFISDSFYRQLFMSPCLSGWDQGEEKHRYMSLCHMVLSRSQLNTLAKLKEAGIIARNLVVLPSTSNICLANNGIHLSLGSRRLTDMLKNGRDYNATDEKYYGDLVIKICEHFLPLFVGTYSAAPYRFDFQDFHPEKVLGFLPHELDYTHLRMLWRRWKQKADINLFGPHLILSKPQKDLD